MIDEIEIAETHYWDQELEKKIPFFDEDIQSSFSQHIRIFTRPLTTKNPENCSFSSWRGRLVSMGHFGKLFFKEVFEVVKNVVVLIFMVAELALEALNFAFSG